MSDFHLSMEFTETLRNLELRLMGRGNRKAVRRFFESKEKSEGVEAGKMNTILSEYRDLAVKLFDDAAKRYSKLYGEFDPIEFINLLPNLTGDLICRYNELLSKSETEHEKFIKLFESAADSLTEHEMGRAYSILEDFWLEQQNYRDSVSAVPMLLESVRAYYTVALITGLGEGDEETLLGIMADYVTGIGLDVR